MMQFPAGRPGTGRSTCREPAGPTPAQSPLAGTYRIRRFGNRTLFALAKDRVMTGGVRRHTRHAKLGDRRGLEDPAVATGVSPASTWAQGTDRQDRAGDNVALERTEPVWKEQCGCGDSDTNRKQVGQEGRVTSPRSASGGIKSASGALEPHPPRARLMAGWTLEVTERMGLPGDTDDCLSSRLY